MFNLVTFEQLFHIFSGHLEMQVDYAKYAYARTCTKGCHLSFHQYFIFYWIVDGVIHRYIVKMS